MPPNASLCFPMPAFVLSLQKPSRLPATPSHARPPKNCDSLIKGIPNPYSGVPYRAPIKYALFVRFAVDSSLWSGAKRPTRMFTFVYKCLQLYLFRGVTKMIVTQQVVSGVPALVKVHRLLSHRSLGTKAAGLSLPQAFCIACSSASCGGRVYCCNQLVTAVTSFLRYCRNHLLQP